MTTRGCFPSCLLFLPLQNHHGRQPQRTENQHHHKGSQRQVAAATYRENHSPKWIALSVAYYVAFSLAISCVFYHVGLLIWG